MNESLLVNTLGHSAGVLIFGIVLFLLIEDRAARRLRRSAKPMLAAALALVWNLASLVVLGMGSRDIAEAPAAAAIAFSVLSLLPAVLFDLCLSNRQRRLVTAGYFLSSVAIMLHVAELFQARESYHRWGLGLISVGFGLLTCIAAFSGPAESRQAPRVVGTMSLFLLAMSFVHLGSGHAQQIWSRELAFHHAAIPLALLVLLQDYRFVLLDAFLRFLANVLLAALFISGVAAAWRWGWLRGASTPFEQAILLVGGCLLLIVFALFRLRAQKLLTHLVFRRAPDDVLLRRLKSAVRDETEYIQRATSQLSEFMGAPARVVEDARLDSQVLHRPMLVSEFSVYRAELELGEIEVVLPLHSAARPAKYVLFGRRSGGRRYLSEDLSALAQAASVIVEQIEQHRESEMRRLVAQAELRALQSQIHPHFLFNALNALYGIIPRDAKGARETVLNLADIFRYFLETRKTYLPLEEELRIVKAYLEVERLRLGEKLRTEVNVEQDAMQVPIPALTIQPLVENAVKHGIAPLPQGGVIQIQARRLVSGELSISVLDTGAGFTRKESSGGVGLDNVAKRLELCYGRTATLNIESNNQGTSVSFEIPAEALAATAAPVGGESHFEAVAR